MRQYRWQAVRFVLAVVMAGSWAVPATATPISVTPYLGITITKDSLSLPAPVDPMTHVEGIINGVATQRFVGSSLAIFADPVPAPEPLTLILLTSGACVGIARIRRSRRDRLKN